MQEVYARLVRDQVSPALKATGLRKRGRTTWWERRPGGGWVLLALVGSRHNTSDLVEFYGEASCWPPGTWEFACEFHGLDPDDEQPYVAANAPVDLDSRVPAAGGPARPEWRLGRETDPALLGDEVLAWALEALGRARACCDDLEHALAELVDRPGWPGWRPTYAIAMLRATAPDHPRLPEIIEGKTAWWREDPRPIRLRPHLERWRSEAGLPDVDLPTFWSPSMQPHAVERYGSAQAAFRAGFGTSFQYADGTESSEPPPGWLDQAPSPLPDGRPRRRWPWRRS